VQPLRCLPVPEAACLAVPPAKNRLADLPESRTPLPVPFPSPSIRSRRLDGKFLPPCSGAGILSGVVRPDCCQSGKRELSPLLDTLSYILRCIYGPEGSRARSLRAALSNGAVWADALPLERRRLAAVGRTYPRHMSAAPACASAPSPPSGRPDGDSRRARSRGRSWNQSLTNEGLLRHSLSMSVATTDVRSRQGQMKPRPRAGEALRASHFANFASFSRWRPPRS
jgi:hypothetical protein